MLPVWARSSIHPKLNIPMPLSRRSTVKRSFDSLPFTTSKKLGCVGSELHGSPTTQDASTPRFVGIDVDIANPTFMLTTSDARETCVFKYDNSTLPLV